MKKLLLILLGILYASMTYGFDNPGYHTEQFREQALKFSSICPIPFDWAVPECELQRVVYTQYKDKSDELVYVLFAPTKLTPFYAGLMDDMKGKIDNQASEYAPLVEVLHVMYKNEVYYTIIMNARMPKTKIKIETKYNW